MTEEKKSENQEPEKKSEVKQEPKRIEEPEWKGAPKEPSLSAEDIAKQVAGNLNIEKEVRKSLQALVAPEKKKESNPIHQQFLEDPATFVNDILEIAEKRVEQKNETKAAAAARRQEELGPVANEYAEKHPGLKTDAGSQLVELEFAKAMNKNPDMSEKEAFESACKKAVGYLEALGVKSPTEEERRKEEQNAYMPPMGGSGLPGDRNGFSNASSSQDFLARQKAAREAFRKPTQNQDN